MVRIPAGSIRLNTVRGFAPRHFLILSRSRHRPVIVTDGSLTENVNKTGVRLWTGCSLDRHSEVRSRDALDTIAHGAIAKLDPMKWGHTRCSLSHMSATIGRSLVRFRARGPRPAHLPRASAALDRQRRGRIEPASNHGRWFNGDP
jgi:hypothetical protein